MESVRVDRVYSRQLPTTQEVEAIDPVTLTRGTATVRELAAALTELGIKAGEEFVVARADSGVGRSLADAKADLRERLDDGADCPCCGQRAQRYRRHISGKMAADLIRCYKAKGTDWFYVPEILDGHPGDFAKLAYWELIEARPGEREDGSNRTGWWRVTPRGREFVLNRETVPYTALIYDGEVEGHEGPAKTIRDCLGKRFRYDELMRGD